MGTLPVAARRLSRHKPFLFFASASIAIGLGVCLAFLAVIDALLRKPIDAPQAQRLVDVSTRLSDGRREGLSVEAAVALTEGSPLFRDAVAWTESSAVVALGGTTARGTLLAATGNIFDFLGTTPAAGRLLIPDDGGLSEIGRPSDALVLGHAFWQRVYDANPAVVGQIAIVKEIAMRVVGIAPPGFRAFSATSEPDLVVSLPAFAALAGSDIVRMRDPRLYWLTVTARLSPHSTTAAAADYLRSRWPSQTSTLAGPESLERRVEVAAVATGYAPFARATYARILYIGLVSGIVALFVAAVNVATLMLARTAGRIGEYRLKFALGASFARLVQDMLRETTCVVTVSGVLALVVSQLALRVLWQWMSNIVPAIASQTSMLSWRLAGATAALMVVATAIVSAPPVWLLVRERRRLGVPGAPSQLPTGTSGRALVALQIALATAVVAAAVLLMGSLRELVGTDPGYRSEAVAVAALSPKAGHYRAVHGDSYFAELLAATRSVPGVEAVALAQFAPGSGASPARRVSAADGPAPGANFDALVAQVSDGFFQVMDLPIVDGRSLLPSDTAASETVALLSASIAADLFGRASAVGHYVTIGQPPQMTPARVVGVVGDAHLYDLRNDNRRILYLAQRQAGQSAFYNVMLVRTGLPMHSLIGPLRRAVSALGVDDVTSITPLPTLIRDGLRRDFLLASTVGAVAVVVVLLAMLGVYGLSSYSTSLRAGELRVRAALGASNSKLVEAASRRLWYFCVVGALVGTPLALLMARVLSPFLFGGSLDPALVAGASAFVVSVIALLASLPPVATSLRGPLSSSMRILE